MWEIRDGNIQLLFLCAHSYLSDGSRVERSCIFGIDKWQGSQGSPRAWQVHLLVGEKNEERTLFPSKPRTPSLPASH